MTEGRLEGLTARAGEASPDWNEVREQRVLAAIQRAPRRSRRPVRGRTIGAVAAVAVAAAAALGLWLTTGEDATSVAGRLELADGSLCRLSPDARVRVLAQSEQLIRLEQTAGEVEYDVTRRPERAFEVVTDAAVVRVRGTRFTVTVAPETIGVAVSEGRVEVEARGQQTILSAGDALRVSRDELQATAAQTQSPDPVGDREAEGSAAAESGGIAAADGRGPRRDPTTEARGSTLGAADGPSPRTSESADRASSTSPHIGDPASAAGRRDGQPSRRPRRPVSGTLEAAGAGTTAGSSAETADGAGDGSGDEGAGPDEAAASPAVESAAVESAAVLLERADAHRRAGRSADAARQLERLLADHPDDPRAASAAFTLGRLENRLGQPARAAAAFARSRGAAPAGPLAEDALAEEANAWAAAGVPRRARDAARRYLALHPDGLHAPRMRALAD